MFTGLVEGVGVIIGLTPMAEGLRIAVKTSFSAAELILGESVAVAGACLTVVAINPPAASFVSQPAMISRTASVRQLSTMPPQCQVWSTGAVGPCSTNSSDSS